MKYIGFYWTLFAPMIKKSIANRFGKELAEEVLRNGKTEYRQLLAIRYVPSEQNLHIQRKE